MSRVGPLRLSLLSRVVCLGTLGVWAGLGKAPRVEAQLTPVRAEQGRALELTFPTPRHLNLPTPEPLARGEFYYSIMHTFGEVKEGAGTFWGIDRGANVRFSMEYGITDRMSVLVARSSMDRVYEMGARVRLLAQTSDGSTPVSLGLQVSGGIMTLDEEFLSESAALLERTHVSAAIPISWGRESLSLLLVPMAASLDRTFAFQRVNNPADLRHLGLGLGARVKRGRVTSFTAQALPTYGMTSGDVRTVLGLGVDLETGGHVFQMFFTNSQGLNDTYLLAAPIGDIGDGGFRFGFNLNRSFQLF
jgi:hypothetical protein